MRRGLACARLVPSQGKSGLNRIAATMLLLAGLSGAALAQAPSPEADRTLWCASAFYWLAASAEDAGDAAEAELYDRWSGQLVERVTADLLAAGQSSDAVDALLSDYDEQVLTELGTAEATHDIEACPPLVETR